MHRFAFALLAASGIALAAAQSASAAEIARPGSKAPVPAGAAVYNWTGFYVGGHVGWAWVREDNTVVADPSGAFPVGFIFSSDRDGFFGGAQIGFNWQSGNWVFGVEGDWSWAHSDTSVLQPSLIVAGLVATATADDKWFATLTGRVGYAQDNWLVYVKGGAAWLNVDYGASATGVPVFGTVTTGTIGDTRSGWTVGGGIEWALWSNWSTKIEYNYMDFGSDRYTFTVTSPPAAAGTGGTVDIDTRVHALKLGLNYRFGPGLLAAKY